MRNKAKTPAPGSALTTDNRTVPLRRQPDRDRRPREYLTAHEVKLLMAAVLHRDPLYVGPDLSADAEAIRAKLDRLLARDGRFRASWEQRRRDLPDQSLSSYDLSLCTIAARHGWPDPELAALIRARREARGDHSKGLRRDWS